MPRTYDRHQEISCHPTLYAPDRNHTWVAYRDEESRIYGYGASAQAAIHNLIHEEDQILDD